MNIQTPGSRLNVRPVAFTGVSRVTEGDASSFDREVLQPSRTQPVLVDFYADWCAPCRMLSPQLDNLADSPKYQGVKFVKINIDKNQELAKTYNIKGIPALRLFRNEQIVDQVTGLNTPAIRQMLDKATGS